MRILLGVTIVFLAWLPMWLFFRCLAHRRREARYARERRAIATARLQHRLAREDHAPILFQHITTNQQQGTDERNGTESTSSTPNLDRLGTELPRIRGLEEAGNDRSQTAGVGR